MVAGSFRTTFIQSHAAPVCEAAASGSATQTQPSNYAPAAGHPNWAPTTASDSPTGRVSRDSRLLVAGLRTHRHHAVSQLLGLRRAHPGEDPGTARLAVAEARRPDTARRGARRRVGARVSRG